MDSTTSGFPIRHPSTQSICLGASLEFPAGAPASTQLFKTSTSDCVKVRSLENLPKCGSANHGGIFFVSIACLMAFAHGRVSSYVMNDIGAASPGRWQV